MLTREWTTDAVLAPERFGYWQRAICDGIVGAETESPRAGPFMARMAARHAADFGADSSRIALAGHSAGAHLAAMLLSCRWKQLADDLPAQPLANEFGDDVRALVTSAAHRQVFPEHDLRKGGQAKDLLITTKGGKAAFEKKHVGIDFGGAALT